MVEGRPAEIPDYLSGSVGFCIPVVANTKNNWGDVAVKPKAEK
jgi:hypothetical protein